MKNIVIDKETKTIKLLGTVKMNVLLALYNIYRETEQDLSDYTISGDTYSFAVYESPFRNITNS